MSLTKASIGRPMLITMFFLAIVVLGLITRSRMPVEQSPDVDFPFVTVVTVYAGAGPEEIETLVSKPIEDAVGSIANLKNITSTSQDGVSIVSLEFELGTDLAEAAADAREKVDSIRASLPDEIEAPSITKADISAQPVMTIAMIGDKSARELRRLADDVVKDRLGRVKGAAAVSVNGGDLREIQVLVRKERLDAYGISIADVAAAIRGENLNVPAGSIKQGNQEFAVRVVGEFQSSDQVSAMRLHIPDNRGGGPGWNVRLSEMAEVQDTKEDPDIVSRLNGQPAVIMAIQKQSDANTVEVAEGAKEELENLQTQLPSGVKFVIATDESEFVEEQLKDTNKELILSIILVVIVVFLFLHSARATFIVSLAIPTSLFATFIPMAALGFTINFMTMLALTLAIGILVDDAIVVLENIDRHLEEGEPPREAALNGRSEIGLAAVSITLVDVVVFIPIAFMGGIVGQFFRSFGITVAVAALFSLLVSFTLTPMMASRFYKRKTRRSEAEHKRSGWEQFWHRAFNALDAGFHKMDETYRGLLNWTLVNRWLTVAIGVVSLTTVIIPLTPAFWVNPQPRLVNLVLFVGIVGGIATLLSKDKKAGLAFMLIAGLATVFIQLKAKGEFIPELDRGQVAITIEAPAGSSMRYTTSAIEKLESIVAEVPETEYYVSTIGARSAGGFLGGGDTGSQYGRISLQLVDRGGSEEFAEEERAGKTEKVMVSRTRGIEEIVNELRAKVAREVPGVKVIIFNAESQQVGTAPIAMEIQGADTQELSAVSERIAEAISKVPGTRDVETSWQIGRPELQVIVDRDRASDRGISTAAISNALRTSVEGNIDSKFRVEGTEYNIRVQLQESDRATVESVSRLVVGTQLGQPVYLADVADVSLAGAPTKIDRKNRQRQVTVSSYLTTGSDLSTVQAGVDQALKNVPKGNTIINTGGAAQVQQESFGYIFSALGLAVVLVYMLMAGLFESLFNPFIIMFSLPQALVGALLMLVIRGQSFSIISMIGIILLMGIVTKNAILLIDFISTLRARGHDRTDAILIAGPTRLRPILMTTISLVAALLPVMFAISKGSEQRSPLATAVVGGLLVSTLLTLLVIPASYTIMEDFVNTVKRLFKRVFRRRAVA